MALATQKGNFNKTRFAPTPSGFLHLGNLYSFMVTSDLAKQRGAKILLRIDDMDSERVRKPYIGDIFETLHFFNLNWDEGPKDSDTFYETHSQHTRLPYYREALNNLVNRNAVYACKCSRSEIDQRLLDKNYEDPCQKKSISHEEKNVCWRLKTSEAFTFLVQEANGTSIQAKLPHEMQNFIVRRKNGLPSYHLISLIDDVYFKIDLIVRGNDLWPSTLAQLYLARVLGLDPFLNSHFHHHPLILDANLKKLSKSDGDTSIHSLRLAGLNPRQIYEQLIELQRANLQH